MFISFVGPFGDVKEGAIDANGATLGQLLGSNADAVAGCLVNNKPRAEWKSYRPVKKDRVTVHLKTGTYGIAPAGAAAAGSAAAYTGAQLALIAVINTAVSLSISMALSALMPKPKSPKLDSKRAEAFGIAGFNNTTGPGTPIFTCYGLNRVAGHVIGSGATLSQDGLYMEGKVLYCLGDAGGDGYGAITEIELDGISADNYPDLQIDIRYGTNDQTVIPEFENVEQLWAVGQVLNFRYENQAPPNTGDPYIYSTHNNTVQRAVVFLQFPGGLNYYNDKGEMRSAHVAIKVERKKSGDPDWIVCDMSTWGNENHYDNLLWHSERRISEFFRTFTIDFPEAATWELRFTIIAVNGNNGNSPLQASQAGAVRVVVYNIQEVEFTTSAYPGFAIVGVSRIPARQISSLEAVRISALVQGKNIKIPDGAGGYSLAPSRQRCWIVRDIMTHQVVGMGNEIAESEIDDAQWLESQNYYDVNNDATIVDQDGNMEVRDYCDVVVNESRWDWDWVRSIAGEARGRIVPSGLYWKYVIDRPGDPGLLYAEPGNIIEGSLQIEISPPEKEFNQVIAEYRNAADSYRPDISDPISDPEIGVSVIQEALRYDTLTRESQVLRENMIVLKRAALERRRWSFTSPIGAIVSEPLDLDYIAEREIGGDGAYTGFLPAGSTTTTVILPMIVTIEPDLTYVIVVQNPGNNTNEMRDVSTAAGTWGAVTVTAPFTTTPQEGDLFALGLLTVSPIVTRAQDLEIDSEGRVRQIRTLYDPAVYTPDPLESALSRRNFVLHAVPPLPLRDASVVEQIVRTRDGTQQSILIFNITPGLPHSAGVSQGQGVAAWHVIFANSEPHIPSQENCFVGAKLTINGITGRITSYNVTNLQASLDTSVAVNPGDQYVIEWPKYSETSGFKVEIMDVPADPGFAADIEWGGQSAEWALFGKTYGTRWECNAGDQRGEYFFRFTPFNAADVENRRARIVKRVTIVGDQVAPVPPYQLIMADHLKQVSVDIYQTLPCAEDLNGYDVQFYLVAIPDWILLREVSVPAAQSDDASGFMMRRYTANFSERYYGETIIAQARSRDFSNNRSAWTLSGNGVVLTPAQQGDIGVGALTDFAEYVNDASLSGDIVPVDSASLTLQTTGRPVLLQGQMFFTNPSDLVGVSMQVELRRGAEYAGSTLIDTMPTSMGADVANSVNTSQVTLQRIDWQPAGVHTYKLWIVTVSGDTAIASLRRFLALEIKDKDQAA